MLAAMEALSAEKWSLCLDNEGRVLDQYNVRKIVFHKVNQLRGIVLVEF